MSKLAKKFQLAVTDLILAGFAVFLGRYSRKRDLCFGLFQGSEAAPGPVQVIRTPLASTASFAVLCQKIAADRTHMAREGSLPLPLMIDLLSENQKDIPRFPFRVAAALSEDEKTPHPAHRFCDLHLSIHQGKHKLSLQLISRKALFDEHQSETMARHLRQLLHALLTHPDLASRDCRMLNERERSQLLAQMNPGDIQARLADTSLVDLFRQAVAQWPTYQAVAEVGKALTYEQLEQRSQRLACQLWHSGLRPGSRAAISIGVGLDYVTCVIAVLKCGAAWCPVDPSLPQDRLEYILKDAAVKLLLVQNKSERPSSVCPTMDLEIQSDLADVALPERIPPQLPAYIIYTSGSTGTPKGVVVTHANAVSMVKSCPFYVLKAGETAALFNNTAFDVSVGEIWSCLAVGGRAFAADKNTVTNAQAVSNLLKAEKVVAGMWSTALVQQLGVSADFGPMKVAIFGGEQADPMIAAETARKYPELKLVNAYGPTEATVLNLYHVVADVDVNQALPIGRPLDNTRVLLLDETMEPVPNGVTSELLLSGPCLSMGYLNQPAKTAEAFVPNPHAITPGERMYRTGDLARVERDGNLVCLGRKDSQVKVRGYRIELEEITNRLMRLENVALAVTMVREDTPGNKTIVSYVEGEGDEDELIQALEQYLPAYMIPSSIVFMPSFPRNSSDKIDKSALPKPQRREQDYVAPQGETEVAIAAILAKSLGMERVSAEANFFDLGGHSLMAMNIMSQVSKRYDIDPLSINVFMYPSVRQLAAAIHNNADVRFDMKPLVRVPRDRPMPVSFSQERVFYVQRMSPGNVAYNTSIRLKFHGQLAVSVLEATFREIIRRHEILRTSFSDEQSIPTQMVLPHLHLDLLFTDLTGLGPERALAVLEEHTTRCTRHVFDLRKPPFVIWHLFKLGPLSYRLVQIEQHLVHDGWSLSILLGEIVDIYSAFAAGKPSPREELPFQFIDFAVFERERMSGDFLNSELDWWRARLKGMSPLLELPTDRPRPQQMDLAGQQLRFTLPHQLYSDLKSRANREGTTLFVAMLTSFFVLLQRYSQLEDIFLCTATANRTRPEIELLLGMMVNNLILREDMSDNPSLRFLMSRIGQTAFEAYAHQGVPFNMVVDALNPPRDSSYIPFLQACFSFHDSAMPDLELALIDTELEILYHNNAKFDLNVVVMPRPEQRIGKKAKSDADRDVLVIWEYATCLYDHSTMERMVGHYLNILRTLALEPDTRLADVPLLDEAEKQLLLVDFNQTQQPWPGDVNLFSLFAAKAAQQGKSLACREGDQQLSYGELASRVEQLAAVLAHKGVGPNHAVALRLAPSLDLVCWALATVRLGAFYVPITPEYPADRAALMCAEAGAQIIVSRKAVDGLAPLLLPADPEPPAQTLLPPLPDLPLLSVNMMFTSGSTGKPKGVMVSHRGLVRLVTDRSFMALTPDLAFALVANPSFDASSFEIWFPLANGCTIQVVDKETLLDGQALAAFIQTPGIDVMFMTTALFNQFAHGGTRVFHGLRYLLTGGEKMDPEAARLVLERDRPQCLLHVYGPTETTVFATYLGLEEIEPGQPVSIGRPHANTQLYVVDKSFRLSPINVPGEILIGGPALATGYINQPALTAKAFAPDPFSQLPGSRLYRSGDLGRVSKAGLFYCIGRIDNQVKLRGFRIEPDEIAAAITQYPGISQAVVLVREDQPGLRYLAAYATGHAQIDDLRDFLKSLLPDHMVPSAIVLLDSLPLNANGKIDRKALPQPELHGQQSGRKQPLSTHTEHYLARLWQEILGVSEVAANDNFFNLGGHSLLATRLLTRLRADFDATISLATVFRMPTLAELARELERMLPQGTIAATHVERPAVRKKAITRKRRLQTYEARLSFAQERMWFFEHTNPGTSTYNVPMALRFSGDLDVDLLSQCFSEIVARHEVLRTCYRQEKGQPIQVITDAWQVEPTLVDLSGNPSELRQRLDRDLLLPFDLEQAPVLRLSLYRLAQTDHVLLINIHHIACDGWSYRVLLKELAALYPALQRGEDPCLDDLEIQYADYSEWQHEQFASHKLHQQLAYWEEALKGAPPTLELCATRPQVQTFHGAGHEFSLSPASARQLRDVCQQRGVTPYMAMLAAYAVLLSRHAGQYDLCIGSPVANRDDVQVEPMIGFFVNTLVMRIKPNAHKSFNQLLEEVKQTTLAAQDNQQVPFERVVTHLNPERSTAYAPLFQVAFATEEMGLSGGKPVMELEGLQVFYEPFSFPLAKFDLFLTITPGDGLFKGVFRYNTDLFEQQRIQSMGRHYQNLIEAMVANPGLALTHLPMLTQEEQDLLLKQWNHQDGDWPRDRSLGELFQRAVAQWGDSPAISMDQQTLTYRELAMASGRLATRLAQLGIGPGMNVGVCLERSIHLVVGILAILQRGATYVPINPEYPADRIHIMIESAGLRLILSKDPLGSGLTCLDPAAISDDTPCTDHWVALPINAPLYLMFTSGSTGTPKGVVITHLGVLRLIFDFTHGRLAPGDTVAMASNPAFDASTYEYWLALMHGARLYVIDKRTLLEPAALETLVNNQPISLMFMTTSLFNLYAYAGTKVFSRIRTLIFGGEAADPEAVRRVLREDRPGVLINAYGPTECTTFATWMRLDDNGAKLIPIGLPLLGTTAYLTDPQLHLVPPLVPGHLMLGGEGLALGYLNRPALTAERFVPNPFAGQGERLYKSGDLARFQNDGKLVYQGRLDRQLKLRGFRIEPDEINLVLDRHPRVKQAFTMLREDNPGDPYLATYVVTDGERDELSALLRDKLPSFMVPRALVVVDAIPLNANGKVDAQALPKPDISGHDEKLPLQGPTETALAQIWSKLLNVAEVSAGDNFFNLGGHSLLATRLIALLYDHFGAKVSLAALFAHPELRALAAEIDRLAQPQPLDPEPPALPPTYKLPEPETSLQHREGPASFAQTRLWFYEQSQPGTTVYNLPMIFRLQGQLDQDLLACCLRHLVARHETLRTHFETRDGMPFQVISPVVNLPMTYVQEPIREQDVLAALAPYTRRGFVIETGPLFRVTLLREDENKHLLLLEMHHIIGDGWSCQLLVQELRALYGAFKRGDAAPLAPLSTQYLDYTRAQRALVEGPAGEAQMSWWVDQLQGAPPVLDLVPHRPPLQTFDGASYRTELDRETAAGVMALAKRETMTPFMIMLATYGILLSRHARQHDLCVGISTANRGTSDIQALIGFFVNMLVVRIQAAEHKRFTDLLKEVRRFVLEAQANQDLPFERIVDRLAPQRDPSYSPLFQVVFGLSDLRSEPPGTPELAEGLTLEPIAPRSNSVKYDLGLDVQILASHMEVSLTYNTNLFERKRIVEMANHFQTLLKGLLSAPDQPIGKALMLDEGTRKALLQRWHTKAKTGLEHTSLIDLLERKVAEMGDAPALILKERTLSYNQLWQESGRLAAALHLLGVRPGHTVGLMLSPQTELICALLATVRCGAAYLYLASDLPAKRLESMLKDGDCSLVLSTTPLPPLTCDLTVVDPNSDLPVSQTLPRCPSWPQLPAMIIFTSGSTGNPKGILITHGNVINLALNNEDLPLTPRKGVMMTINPSFDPFTYQVWGALLNGCYLIALEEREILDADRLRALISRHEITLIVLPTALFNQLARETKPIYTSVEMVLLGGEAADGEIMHSVLERDKPGCLINGYGPAEATVISTLWRMVPGSAPAPVPIGSPLTNARTYLVDHNLEPVPDGVPGELMIGGTGLASGYARQPATTASRFIPDPFADRPGERIYRSGDLVRCLPDGINLTFIGRMDHQIKWRGFRIELSEIENRLNRLPEVGNALAMMVKLAGENRLITYVTLKTPLDDPSSTLRNRLANEIPAYMIPDTFVVLDEFPITTNGKVDRARLPLPTGESKRRQAVKPSNRIQARIAEVWCTTLGVDEVSSDANFFEIGGNSLLLVRVKQELAPDYPDLKVVDLFRFPTIDTLAEFLAQSQPQPSQAAQNQPKHMPTAPTPVAANEAIAVIGVAGRFPGALDINQFWQNLVNGVEPIVELSDEQLLGDGVSAERFQDPMFVRQVFVLDQVEHFDAAFFDISPAEAAYLDPQHRFFMEDAWHALEDGCVTPMGGASSHIGVFAGAGMSLYMLQNLVPRKQELSLSFHEINSYCSNDFLATRVTYKLGLTGPAVNVQSACSTSLVAIHLACEALRRGECSYALAGGVSISPHQHIGYLFQEGMIFSRDGHCRPFDAAASGTNSGKGSAVVLLQPLAAALAAKAPIRAVIKGSAINNDGDRKVNFFAPGVDGQAEVIARAQAIAQVRPEQISYVETHGTATPLGDPIEIAALNQVWGPDSVFQHCWLGSLKSNIGHLDAAAGVAGFIKTTLALQHALIPPSLNYAIPNPEIDFGPFQVNIKTRPWPLTGEPHRAGVSSFGIGGTNAHVILEEAPSQPPTDPALKGQLLLLSAKTPEALTDRCSQLAQFLQANRGTNLADAAYTLMLGRRHFKHRRFVVCGDADDAIAQLQQSNPEASGSHERNNRPLVFMFPGQGSQYPQMGADLYQSEAVFKEAFDYCNALLGPLQEAAQAQAPTMFDMVYPNGLMRTRNVQPILFSLEYALARLLLSWGLQPAAMIGHSLGEYVAATLAGVFSLEDAVKLVALRGRLMDSAPEGVMLAVPIVEEDLLPLLGEGLDLAAVNSLTRCVVSGSDAAITALEQRLAEGHIYGRRLKTSHGFHSASMDGMLEEFTRELSKVKLSPPQIPFISNLTGTWITGEMATDPSYWARHLRQTVQFGRGIRFLADELNPIFMEVGPGRTLCSFASGPHTKALPCMRHERESHSDREFLLSTLGRLWLAGADLNFEALFSASRRRLISLPTYPFQRKRHWIDRPGAHQAPQETKAAPPVVAARTMADSSAELDPHQQLAQTLKAMWSQLLGFHEFNHQTTLFDLGGDSMLATRLLSRIRRELGVNLTMADLFQAPTIDDLAHLLSKAHPSAPRPQAQALEQKLVEAPLSYAQMRFWIEDHISGGNAWFNTPSATRMRGPLDLEALQQALDLMVSRHQSLRTRFPSRNHQGVQVVEPPFSVAVAHQDLSTLPEDQRELAFARAMEQEQTRVFRIEKTPLFQVTLFRLGEADHILLFNIHHIVFDGWSHGVFMKELSQCYNAFKNRQQPELTAPTFTYIDFSIQQQDWLEGQEMVRQKNYWKEKLAGVLPVFKGDRPRPENPSYTAGVLEFALDDHMSEKISRLSAEYRATPFMVLLTAFKLALMNYLGKSDILVGTTISNRNRVATENLIGFMVNLLVLRTEMSSGASLGELLQRVKQTTLDAYAHQDLPFQFLVEELNPRRVKNHHPLFQVLFSYQKLGTDGQRFDDLKCHAIEPKVAHVTYDLSLNIWQGQKGIRAMLAYQVELFEHSTIQAMVDQFLQSLRALCDTPETVVAPRSINPAGQKESFKPEQALPLPIGRPFKNQQIYILNDQLAPVPLGIPGEIYLGGQNLARGYLNQPALTAKAYLPNPFGEPGSRLYRTGDLAVLEPEGEIRMQGRADAQIKLRGLRVEPADIEAHLAKRPEVNQALVIARENTNGETILVAYFTANEAFPQPDPREIRAELFNQLPDYMVPAAIVHLAQFPLSANGKIDRRALPEPVVEASQATPPRDELEAGIVQIWQRVLEKNTLGIFDNFFELGGHSLLSIRLMSEIEERFGVRVPVLLFFENPTPAHLAELVKTRSQAERSPLVVIRERAKSRPLFLFHAIGGDTAVYRNLCDKLQNYAIYGLEAPGLEGGPVLEGLETITNHYLKAIQSQQPEGPYTLIGYSAGGILAMAVEAKLRAVAQRCQTILLDTSLSFCRPDLPEAWITKTYVDLLDHEYGGKLNLPRSHFEGLPLDRHAALILERARQVGVVKDELDANRLLWRFNVMHHILQACSSWRPCAETAPAVLFQASERVPALRDTQDPNDFATWGINVKRVLVPGTHTSMLSEKHAAHLAHELESFLEINP